MLYEVITFVGPDPDLPLLHPGEVHVGAPGGELPVVADAAAGPRQVDRLQIGNEQHRVRHARVDEGIADPSYNFV